MSTRYNTGNPIESADVRDMSDNAKNLDLAINSDQPTFQDRLGVNRSTISGLQAYADAALSSIGYNFIGNYSAGLTINSVKDVVRYDGILYSNAGTLPRVTSGSFASDGPWVALSAATGIFLYSFVATAGQTDFTIGNAVSPGTIPIVFKRGVYQINGDAYTIDPSDGRRFVFSEPMIAGDKIQIMAMSGADNVVKGDYKDFIYKNSITQPATPSGENHAEWSASPQTPPNGSFTWVSTARRNGNDGSLIGAWSAPSRISGEDGDAGASVSDVVFVSSTQTSSTYKFLLSNGLFTSDYIIPNGADVEQIELVSKVGKVATYRFILSNGAYTNTFEVIDGVDGSGSVSSVNGVSPDVSGNVQLSASDLGASSAWVNDTANTGTLNTSSRVRWLVDTSAARDRAIGDGVTELMVKDVTGQAGANNITITAPSGKTINGATTETIDVNYGWVHYVLIGTDFKTIGGK